MHVITNRPVGPLRHSAFLPRLRLHFLPPSSLPSHHVSKPFFFFPSFPCFPTSSYLCFFFNLLCVLLPLNLGRWREETSHYFKEAAPLAANPHDNTITVDSFTPPTSSCLPHLLPNDLPPLFLCPVSWKQDSILRRELQVTESTAALHGLLSFLYVNKTFPTGDMAHKSLLRVVFNFHRRISRHEKVMFVSRRSLRVTPKCILAPGGVV